jgi:hypothetical protein
MAQATAPILDSTDPEAFESEDEFRLLTQCRRNLLGSSSFLHDPQQTRIDPSLVRVCADIGPKVLDLVHG